MRKDPMLDKDFLKKLDEWNEREVYIKLISLDFHENPRSEIQGYATGGSISVNGASAVRRTCSLSLLSDQININEFDWALETKFRVYVGLRNFVDTENYEDIIWFKQGTYVITSFSQTYNTQGYSISIQGKDKMCLLDGTVGGILPFAHDFGKIEITHYDGTVKYEDIPIYTIIRDAIHTYAQEPYENIVINDLEDISVELLSYYAKDNPLFIFDILDGVTEMAQMAFKGASDIYDYLYDAYIENGKVDGVEVDIPGKGLYRIVKHVDYGDTAGYRKTDLTYVGDLIFGAGSALTKMLDAVVKQLGEFEYFYDIDGKFVFQRKKIYFNISWNNGVTVDRQTYYADSVDASASAYTFTNSILIDTFSNKPNLNAIKNDIAIWGKLTTAAGTDMPINLRYAIDDKPTYYKSLLDGYTYGIAQYVPDEDGDYEARLNPTTNKLEYIQLAQTDKRYPYIIQYYKRADRAVDWREIIYRMALDQSKSSTKIEDLTYRISQSEDTDEIAAMNQELEAWKNTWNTGYDAYYPEFLDTARWRKLYICRDERPFVWKVNEDGNDYKEYTLTEEEYSAWSANGGWNPDLVYYDKDTGAINIIDPGVLTFWFDFLDADTYLDKYKVSVIGRRAKAVNDNDVKCIFNRTVPLVLFLDPTKNILDTESTLGYTKLNLPGGLTNYFRMSTQGKSAGEAMDSLIYESTYYQESITLSSIPVYYLEPNTRITVYDSKTGINGEYVIKQFTMQLSHDGAMSITATKAEESIL